MTGSDSESGPSHETTLILTPVHSKTSIHYKVAEDISFSQSYPRVATHIDG
jgi:hypothetical protein